MLNLPHDSVRSELNCGDAKSFNWVNLSSFRDDNVDNGIVTQVVSDGTIRITLGSTKDKWLIMINNTKMILGDIVTVLVDPILLDSMKWMNEWNTHIYINNNWCFS